ncbi:MAG: hypothetical protein ACOY94_27220 [Bacillota bacterium]
MPRPLERVAAVLCYTGAMRVPVVALVVPDWVFTVPSGLLVAAALWLYSRKRSPFVHHHARAGLVWAVQANGLLLILALVAKLFYFLWFRTGIPALNQIWHGTAEGFRWIGLLVTLLTLVVMVKAAKGQTGDPLGLPH